MGHLDRKDPFALLDRLVYDPKSLADTAVFGGAMSSDLMQEATHESCGAERRPLDTTTPIPNRWASPSSVSSSSTSCCDNPFQDIEASPKVGPNDSSKYEKDSLRARDWFCVHDPSPCVFIEWQPFTRSAGTDGGALPPKGTSSVNGEYDDKLTRVASEKAVILCPRVL